MEETFESRYGYRLLLIEDCLRYKEFDHAIRQVLAICADMYEDIKRDQGA